MTIAPTGRPNIRVRSGSGLEQSGLNAIVRVIDRRFRFVKRVDESPSLRVRLVELEGNVDRRPVEYLVLHGDH